MAGTASRNAVDPKMVSPNAEAPRAGPNEVQKASRNAMGLTTVFPNEAPRAGLSAEAQICLHFFCR